VTAKNFAVICMKADGTVTKTVQKSKPNLEQLQGYVRGPIEQVPFFTSLRWAENGPPVLYGRGECWANEEGMLRGLPRNAKATVCWALAIDRSGKVCEPLGQFLHGDVVFVARTEEKCE